MSSNAPNPRPSKPLLRRRLPAVRRRGSRAGPRPPREAGAAAAEALRPQARRLVWAAAALALLAAAIAVLAAVWDWNWFRAPLARLASDQIHRQVTIAGRLDVHPWSWRPAATVDGISIANPQWAGRQPMGSIDRLTVRVRLLPLLIGRVDLRELRLDHPRFGLVADAQGRRNWEFSPGRPAQPADLPPIHSFIVQGGQFSYVDSRRDIRFEGLVNAHERYWRRRQGFEMTGQGTINGAPFHAAVTGGPLVNVRRDQPYPFNADIHAGATHVAAHGEIPRPFDLARFHMDVSAQGPDLARLFPLTGVALPNTPPYRLKAHLVRQDLVWRIEGLGGRVGDSDLAGDLAVRTGGERPRLTGALRSRVLDFDDLGAVFGGAPGTGRGETASPRQAATAQRLAGQERLFPDAPLDLARIRAMDADVSYRAQSIRDAPVNLAAGQVRIALDDGVLRAEPLAVDLPQGRVSGRVTLDARRDMPVTDLDLRLSGARVEQLLPLPGGAEPALAGPLAGRARLVGSGRSVHEAMSHANGDVAVVASHGEIRRAFAELAGVNVIKGLGLLLGKDQSTTPVRCAVADFHAADGVMRTDNLVVDTGPVLVTGSGQVDLGRERLGLKIQGHDKKLRLGRLLLPVKATGPIRAPKLEVEPGAAMAQGGLAAVLGSVLSPLAAILPFVDPGLAHDADCGAMLAQASAPKALTPKR